MVDPNSVVASANTLALVGWLVLIVGPRHRAITLATGLVLPALLAIGYAALVLPTILASEGGFDSLGSIRTLFASDALLAGGWLHYLAFDLFVGTWIARRADRAAISRLLQAPVLLATFLVGPLGLLLFLLMDAALSAVRALKIERARATR